MKTKQKPIPGLRLERKLGQIISVNHGELLIQVIEIAPSRVKLALHSQDPKKYVFSRGEIAHLYTKKLEEGREN